MDIVRAYLQRIKNELYPANERASFQQRLLKAFSGIIPTASGSASYALTGLQDVREVQKILEGAALSILNEIKDLPKTIEPGWLEELEKDEVGGK